MNTRHSFTPFLGLAAAAALFTAVAPRNAHAGEPAARQAVHARSRHQDHRMNYVSDPGRETGRLAVPAERPATTGDKPLSTADYRSSEENNLVNPG